MSTNQTVLAHHFDNIEQQKESLILGMWIFLVTEIMIFGGLFVSYIVYRYMYPTAFGEASGHLSWPLASLNTVVLISSSFTMAMAVYGAQVGKKQILVGGMLFTVVLGITFLGIKAGEYTLDYHEGLTPLAHNFNQEIWKKGVEAGIAPAEYFRQVKLFLTLYYIMTGLHATHMIAGLAILGVMIVRARRDWYTPEYHPGVEMMGLYWHFVDVIWIFLLPMLYLLGTH